MAGEFLENRRETPTDARQVRSRNALTGALLALLEERAFDQITIREISARAGTGYATFFRHYPTKEALLADIASEEIALLRELIDPIFHDANSFDPTLAMCNHVDQKRSLWTALLTGGAASIVRVEFIRQSLERTALLDRNASWLPADLGVVHGTGSTIEVLAWWLRQPDQPSPREIATILHRLVIAPFLEATGLRSETAR